MSLVCDGFLWAGSGYYRATGGPSLALVAEVQRQEREAGMSVGFEPVFDLRHKFGG